MIIIILKIILITTCLVWGVKISTEEGMVFEKLGMWADKKIESGQKYWEAILRCPFCMPSFWGLVSIGIGYLLNICDSWNIFIAYPVIVGGASLVSGMIWTCFQLISAAAKYFKFLNGDN